MAVEEFDKRITKWAKIYKLIINKKKTETQFVTNRREKILVQKEEVLKRFFPEYECTRNFSYLGSQITTKLKMEQNIKTIKKRLSRFTCLMMNMHMKNIDIINRYNLWRVFIRS